MCLPIHGAIVNSEAPWSRPVQCKSPQRMLQRLETFCTSATLMELFCFVYEWWLHFFHMDSVDLQMSEDDASSKATGQGNLIAHIGRYSKSGHTVLAWDPSPWR